MCRGGDNALEAIGAEPWSDDLWDLVLSVAQVSESVERATQSLELSLLARHAIESTGPESDARLIDVSARLAYFLGLTDEADSLYDQLQQLGYCSPELREIRRRPD